MVLNNSNRQNGDWLPGVEKCEKRLQPCGNAFCVDEAMRAGGIESANKIETPASRHAFEHALKIASQCTNPCPLDNLAINTRSVTLEEIKKIHSQV